MPIDTRTGAAPRVGGTFRMTLVDVFFTERHVEYQRIDGFSAVSPATGAPRLTYFFHQLSTPRLSSGLVSANLCGQDWYRLFEEVPRICAPSGSRFL